MKLELLFSTSKGLKLVPSSGLTGTNFNPHRSTSFEPRVLGVQMATNLKAVMEWMKLLLTFSYKLNIFDNKY